MRELAETVRLKKELLLVLEADVAKGGYASVEHAVNDCFAGNHDCYAYEQALVCLSNQYIPDESRS